MTAHGKGINRSRQRDNTLIVAKTVNYRYAYAANGGAMNVSEILEIWLSTLL